MRILELEIDNVRGIRHILLKLNGENAVVWGPNGSGKSAVVDAIDFLLTGRISRLMGKGTRGLTLNRHGCHVDHRPKEAKVRGILRLPGVSKPIEVVRCMDHPDDAIYEDEFKLHLEPILDLAKRGQHVLTRRDILKYITAEGGTRAEEVQALLNIRELEDIRGALVTAKNTLKGEHKSARIASDRAQKRVCSTVNKRRYDEQDVLVFVNEQRTILGGEPLTELRAQTLKAGLSTPVTPAVNPHILAQDIRNVCTAIGAESQKEVGVSDNTLRKLLGEVQADPGLRRELARRALTQLGLELIDEDGNCPLCDTKWRPGELRNYLLARLKTADRAAEYQQQIEQVSDDIFDVVDGLMANLDKVVKSAQLAGLTNKELKPLLVWHNDLEQLKNSLENALERYLGSRFTPQATKRLLVPENGLETLSNVLATVRAKYPETTPQQNAWDILTHLSAQVKVVEEAQAELTAAALSQKRAETLETSFELARDRVLNQLYNEIGDRFSELYRSLHGPEEDSFTAELHPDGASLDLNVEFYGRGKHPPHALHSEGHQDSMGLCLYLVLAERLTQGMIDLTILDDVVMSIDAGHRRRICNLLSSVFPQKQFLITTHDKNWARQLRTDGVVTRQGSYEFSRWTIETGPTINSGVDLWAQIEQDLARDDVHDAAFHLRRGSEEFFEMACDTLQASVRYKANGNWELGEFVYAAMDRYGQLLRKAKAAANSWRNKDRVEELSESESITKQVFTRVNREWWSVNSSVHYNKWENLEKPDFQPVVEVFRDLYGLFQCSKCGSMLEVAMRDTTEVTVQCHCGAMCWNLRSK